MTKVFAAADIGSNTAHLLVAATDGNLVMRIDNYNEWIPLGETVSRTGLIAKDQVQQLVMSVKEFKRVAKDRKAQSLYIFATEGMRMARNHEQVLKKIATETGITVDIIPPRREAELSLRGVGLDTRNMGADLMFEVGGGSVQIGKLNRSEFECEESLPLGTGRVIAESGLTNPCSPLAYQAADNYIREVLKASITPRGGRLAVASGGVARGLWRALHPDGEKVLTRKEIEYIAWSAARIPIDRIVSRFGVKSKRAGTLLPGALVYGALLDRFQLDELLISEFGIREGAVLEMATGKILGTPL